MENTMYDIIIIGGGVVGMSAAIEAGKSGKKVALVSANIGGKLLEMTDFEIYPGIAANSSTKFISLLSKQIIESYKNIDLITDLVIHISYRHGIIRVSTESKNDLFGRAIICATGKKPIKLKLEKGRDYTTGIYYNPVLEGKQFKNKTVVVVGDGNIATEASQTLSAYDATIIRGNVEETKVKDKSLIGAKLTDGRIVDCDGIFAALGEEPNTKFVRALQITSSQEHKEYIIINDNGITSTDGIFAAGDCTNIQVKNILEGLCAGVRVAKSALDYIK